ncbi:hypothetical protein GF1_23880 [Desulfolithobacter dissulfuricans]|uniref:Uncharacterized protein n=1 Tax=Desulfolithobacter dissulfuricans TaxID=2795293 RepID=A0A915U6B5_9BACT|nr:hypothetical protein GF1_23880 [Desulfolithobacter dissulfuricans]
MAHLGQLGILEKRPERLQEFFLVQLTGHRFAVFVPVAAGQIPDPVSGYGKRYPHKPGPQRIKRRGLGVQDQKIGPAKLGDHPSQLFPVLHQLKISRIHGHRRRIRLEQGIELQFGEEFAQPFGFRGLDTVGLGIGWYLHIMAQPDQIPGEESVLAVSDQPFLELGLFHGIHRRIDSFQGPVFADKLLGGLGPHPGHPGNVVRTVAGEGEIIEQLMRLEAIFRKDRGHVHELIAHGIPHHHLLGDQLQQVLVPGNDHHPAAGRHQVVHRRGDQIIGLHVVMFKSWDVIGLDDFPHIGNLRLQIIGHGRTVGLVLGIDAVPEHRASRIKSHRQALGLLFPDDTAKNGGKAIDGVGGQTAGVGQGADGVISPVNIGRAIDQIDLPEVFLRDHELYCL